MTEYDSIYKMCKEHRHNAWWSAGELKELLPKLDTLAHDEIKKLYRCRYIFRPSILNTILYDLIHGERQDRELISDGYKEIEAMRYVIKNWDSDCKEVHYICCRLLHCLTIAQLSFVSQCIRSRKLDRYIGARKYIKAYMSDIIDWTHEFKFPEFEYVDDNDMPNGFNDILKDYANKQHEDSTDVDEPPF